jgi:hypothetical protein
MDANVQKFFDTCVEAIVPINEYPTPVPVATSSYFSVSAKFEASWGNIFDSNESMAACTTANPVAIVSCTNGASLGNIYTIVDTNSTVNCTAISESAMQCDDFANSVVNQFTSVIFVRRVHKYWL